MSPVTKATFAVGSSPALNQSGQSARAPAAPIALTKFRRVHGPAISVSDFPAGRASASINPSSFDPSWRMDLPTPASRTRSILSFPAPASGRLLTRCSIRLLILFFHVVGGSCLSWISANASSFDGSRILEDPDVLGIVLGHAQDARPVRVPGV